MKKVRSVIPCWRERKRYLVFEVLSKSKIKAISDLSKAIWRSHLALCGELGAAYAGISLVEFDAKSQRGILRVNHDQLHNVRASMALVTEVGKEPAVLKSIGVSGILRKAEGRYTAS